MDRTTRIFWALIALLLGASLFFGVTVQRRRAVPEVPRLSSGDLVSVVRLLDGETLVVQNRQGGTATVTLLGIRVFDATQKGDNAARFAELATRELGSLLAGEAARLSLHTPPQDRHGRLLAHLYVGETDIGLELVRRGLALVYAGYPFEGLPLYASEQRGAERERRGLWADADLSERARGLEQRWRREQP